MTDAPLLKFSASTDPGPLEIDEPGSVLVHITPLSTKAYCAEFKFSIPKDVFSGRPRVSRTPPGWVSVDDLGGDPSLDLSPPIADAYSFRFKPRRGGWEEVVENGAFIFTHQVDSETGSSTVTVAAEVSPNPHGQRDQIDEGYVQIEKVRPMVYLRNFVSYDPAYPQVPQPRFEIWKAILLRWETDAHETTIYHNGAPITPDEPGRHTLKAGLGSNTTLFIEAKSTLDGQEQVRYASLTITVAERDALTIEGGLTVDGQSTLAGVTMSGDLVTPGVVSAGRIKGGGLNISSGVIEGDITFKGNVKFEGTVRFNSEVRFENENTIFDNRLVISASEGNNWYIYPSNGGLAVQGGPEGSVHYFFTSDGSLLVIGGTSNPKSTEFLKNADTFKLTAINGIESNNTLAFLHHQPYPQQAMWIRYTDTPESCEVRIEKF